MRSTWCEKSKSRWRPHLWVWLVINGMQNFARSIYFQFIDPLQSLAESFDERRNVLSRMRVLNLHSICFNDWLRSICIHFLSAVEFKCSLCAADFCSASPRAIQIQRNIASFLNGILSLARILAIWLIWQEENDSGTVYNKHQNRRRGGNLAGVGVYIDMHINTQTTKWRESARGAMIIFAISFPTWFNLTYLINHDKQNSSH
jgi:hypothetical protein